MEFQTILFVFGAILFLVGLIGHIKAKEIEVGSTSKLVRVISFFAGTVFMLLSFVYPFHQISEEESKSPASSRTQPTPKNDISRKADATHTYWEKCQENDKRYKTQLAEVEQRIDNSSLSNKIRGEANNEMARLFREYMRTEKDISTADVDPKLVKHFRRVRRLYNKKANNLQRVGDILLSIGDSPDNATVKSANKRIDDVASENKRLKAEFDQLASERESLKKQLSSQYGLEFIDRD